MYERPLTTKIIEELNTFRNLVPDEGFENSKRTAGVKNALLRAGLHFSYGSINATINADLLPEELQREYEPPKFGEWLYDVSICDVAESGRWCMPMVAECEWGSREFIKEDFEKLLVARAGLRVMVYYDHFIEAEELRQWVDLHEGNQAGDTYLLVAYQNSAETRLPFRYRHIIVRPSTTELVE